MITGLAHISLLVHDYDEAIHFYCKILGFELIEDTPLGTKRWVRIRTRGASGSDLVLVRADSDEDKARVGSQAGSRVFLFCLTNDMDKDFAALSQQGVRFLVSPTERPHGKVAVLADLYGNRIDLIEPN